MLWFRACLYFLFYLLMFILSGLCSPCPVQFLASVVPQSVLNVFHLPLIVSPPSAYISTCLSPLCCECVAHFGWALFLLFPWDSCVFETLQFASPFLNLVACFGLWSRHWFQALSAFVVFCVMNHWIDSAPLATPAFGSMSFWHRPWYRAMNLVVVDLIAKTNYFSLLFLALCLYQIMTTEVRLKRWGESGPRFDQIVSLSVLV